MKLAAYLIILGTLTIACHSPKKPDQSISERWWTDGDRTYILSELDRTTQLLKDETRYLTLDQWHFRKDTTHWSIADIVEHLEMQNQLHFREISVMSKSPPFLAFRQVTRGQDEFFVKYATDTTKGEAKWFLQPRGRYDSPSAGWSAFHQARQALRTFVAQTSIDLRKQFTYRVAVQEKEVAEINIGEVRDLHQLLLTGIAHTDRHLAQIKRIKAHPAFRSLPQ